MWITIRLPILDSLDLDWTAENMMSDLESFMFAFPQNILGKTIEIKKLSYVFLNERQYHSIASAAFAPVYVSTIQEI